MNYLSMTDNAIAEVVGRRIKKLRLRKNKTQEEVADRTQISLNTVKSLESGKGKLSTLVAVLRELDALDQLDNLIPEPGISPLEIAKLQGRQRQRASKKPSKTVAPESEDRW